MAEATLAAAETHSSTSPAPEAPRASRGPQAPRIAYADAFRAIAILGVVIHHIAELTHLQVHSRSRSADWLGVWGVDCFFVLTGYLLSKPYLRAIVDRSPFPSTREFLTRRLLRIYPLYLASLVIIVADAIIRGAPVSVTSVLAHVTMTHGFFPPYIMEINAPLWTMAVDAQFYAVLPIVAICVAHALRRQQLEDRARGVWVILIVGSVLSVLARALTLGHVLPTGNWSLITAASRNVVGMGSEFAIGVALALREMRQPLPSQKQFTYCMMLVAGLLLFILLAADEHDTTNRSAAVAMNAIKDLIGGLSAGLLLYGCIRGNFARLEHVIQSRVVGGAAALSYAIYLFHYPILDRAVETYGRPLVAPVSALFFSLLVALPILLIAYAAHTWIEKPFLRLRDKARVGSRSR
jgi:peptidoglycan/LPS O-acetylase OafA/YrhL